MNMANINHKGRSKYTPFIILHRGVTDSLAWKDLSCVAKCLILLVWERHNGTNNGSIPLSHREARSALGIGNTKTVSTFKEAQEHGFLIERTKGSFDWKVGAGQGRATEWELTAEPCDNKPAKSNYRSWKKQTTAPTAGTNGTQGGNRSTENKAAKSSNGSQGGNRSTRIRSVSGS